MLVHIVMMRIEPHFDADTKQQHLSKLEQMLGQLTLSIPELESLEVGINRNTKPAAFDLVLTALFQDEAALERYRVHPDHKIVLDYMAEAVSEVAVVDYLK
ncbi:MAG: Dabb family protein [Bacteroidetes bacterium]|nr:Dabb family protein [Bacteroidota bacterium]MBU1581108.1 Dabb family protein [Bacteroidota bacterium]MBU2465535.1 Dabb family protein [Bacteroidota bacterium]MBU2558064.1 Dabb family protein [Bacteroidota bacterium]